MRESVPVMRYTVIDADGATSFLGPSHFLKMLAASCSRGADDRRSLLAIAEEFDPALVRSLKSSLARIVDGDRERDPPSPAPLGDDDHAVLKVVDDASREMSLTPADDGLVVFNLPAKRIVQVQNSYAELRRQDRGRLRRDGRPVRAYYAYDLPADWQLVP